MDKLMRDIAAHVIGYSLMLGLAALCIWFAVWAVRGALSAMGL